MNIMTSKSNNVVGLNICKLRNQRKMSQTTLAKIIGVSIFAISNMEAGRTIIDSASLDKISEAFGVRLSDLLTFKEYLPASDLLDSLEIAKSKLKEQDLLVLKLQRQIIGLYEKVQEQ
ncbi:hypothetical protein A0256_03380 [Mucilaginibacter sp. PAMC 26640]|nr:hypothetical protein A0256_03380 [Mucilaginibacter sp. PAMC 26640]